MVRLVIKEQYDEKPAVEQCREMYVVEQYDEKPTMRDMKVKTKNCVDCAKNTSSDEHFVRYF